VLNDLGADLDQPVAQRGQRPVLDRLRRKRALAAALRRAVLIGCPAWLLGDADVRCRP
jgi:hypothetical protein